MHEASVSVRPASILALKRRICHEWIRVCDDPEAGYGGEARGSSALCACMDCIRGKGLETCLSEISDTITRLSLMLPCDNPMLEASAFSRSFFPVICLFVIDSRKPCIVLVAMILLLLLLAFTLSTAKPVHDIQRAPDAPSQKLANRGHRQAPFLAATLYDEECNDPGHIGRPVPRNRDCLSWRSSPTQDSYNDLDAVAKLTAVTLPGAPLQQRGIPSEPTSALSSRSMGPPQNRIINLSMTKFRAYTSMVPTALMAIKFEEWYRNIALKIEFGKFAAWAPANIRILEMWDWELTISCDKAIVPWDFVQNFVIDMAEWSANSFSGFYELTIRGQGQFSGLVFLCKMGLADRLQPAGT